MSRRRVFVAAVLFGAAFMTSGCETVAPAPEASLCSDADGPDCGANTTVVLDD